MHFSVLVPVKVSTIKDTDVERASAAKAFYEAMSNIPEDKMEGKSIMDNVILRCNMDNALSLSTAFASAVSEAVDAAMEPYSQDTEDPRYIEFMDETEDLKDEFETGTTRAILYNGKYYGPHDIKGFRVCDDNVVREVTKDGKYFLSPKAQQMVYVPSISYKEFYGTFRKFANDRCTYNKEKKAWGYWSNPNCFWDWYSIGGRWRGGLLVKDTVEDFMRGVPGAGDRDAYPSAPEGYKWVDAARFKDIELEEMARIEETVLRNNHAKYKAIWEGTYEEPDGDDFAKHTQRKPDGLYYFGRRVYDPSAELEEIVANRNFGKETALGHMFHAYLDTEANVPEEYGYYDCDCMDAGCDWNEAVYDFVTDLDPETVIVTVDCHM